MNRICFSIILLLFSALVCADDRLRNEITISAYSDSIIDASSWSRPPKPIAWEASAKTQSGLQVTYERSFWKPREYVSFSWGVNVAGWRIASQSQFAVSAFVDIRLWPFSFEKIDPYITYSVLGPTYLSMDKFGDTDLGANFSFQDFVGIGTLFGPEKRWNVSFKLIHYSNAELYKPNHGFDVPFVFGIGYRY